MKKVQTITRLGLQELYKIACNNWKQEIANLVLFQSGDKIEVEEDLIKKAFNEADQEKKILLQKYFTIKSDKITDRIETMDDVYRALGVSEDEIVPWKKPKNKKQRSQNAIARIQCISEVLNEGLVPDFKNTNQKKYYNYFERTSSGWAVVVSYNVCGAYVGFGFYFETDEKARFAYNNFKEIWSDYLPE